MIPSEKHETAFIIGRFQPIHVGHLKMIEEAKKLAKNIVILLGSANAPPSIRNPFSAEERMRFIRAEFPFVEIIPIMDYPYSDRKWVSQVVSIIENYRGSDKIIFGTNKDESTYYLDIFPEKIKVISLSDKTGYSAEIDATTVREHLFNGKDASQFMGEYSIDLILESPSIANLSKEYLYVKQYKRAWENSPFPPMFVTVDAFVVHRDSFLAVRRKGNPGRGLLAMPGGFLNQNEIIKAAAIRELREETCIEIFNGKTGKQISFAEEWSFASHVFDHPNRSSRGRVITHAFAWKIPDSCSVNITAADDAADALWIPLSTLNDPMQAVNWMEDHWHMASLLGGSL